MVCLAIAVNLIPVFLTTLSVELGGREGLTHEQLGRIGAVTFIGLVAAILVTGPLADRLGAKPFAILGNLLISAGLAILGVAPSYGAVLLAVFVMGFGAGVMDMVLSPIVCALQPHRRAAAMNWLHSFYCTGAVATILIGSLALRLEFGWRQISLWLTLMPLLTAGLFAVLRIPPLVAEGHERTRLRDLWREPYFLAALAAIFLGGATELGMAQWLPAYTETSLGFSKWVGGMSLLGFSLAMAIGRIAAGVAGHRIPPIRMMLFCCWTSVILFLAGCFLPWPSLALTACVLVGLTGSCLWPSMLAVAADRFPRGGASMFGMLAAFGNFGGIFMPWEVGVVADRFSLNIGIATSALCPLLMGLILLRMRAKPAPAKQSL